MQMAIGTFNIVPSNNSGTSIIATPAKIHNARMKSYQVKAAVGSGNGTATFQFYGSAVLNPVAPTTSDLSDWVKIGNPISLTPSGTTPKWVSDGFSDDNAWHWHTCLVTGVSGTNITVGAWISG